MTFSLLLYSREKKALGRNYINTFIWKPALKRAGVPVTRENGSHALRHFYASTALHEGESIKALSEYLGHADPGFTLRTYTHLVEDSAERTKRAVDAVFGHRASGPGEEQEQSDDWPVAGADTD
jgi:integrase